jgi:hypothetical protein
MGQGMVRTGHLWNPTGGRPVINDMNDITVHRTISRVQVTFVAGCCVAGALSIACGFGFQTVEGSGKVITEARTVAAFSAVSLSGNGRLMVEETGSDSLTVTTDDNLLPYIKTEVKDGRLELGTSDNAMTNLRPSKDIVFKLTVKKLDDLGVSGSGEVDVKGLAQDSFKIGISGSGEVTAHGSAGSLDIGVSGSGQYHGQDLAARRATVAISGSGDAVVAASDTLEAAVSGSGSVKYVGDPRVTQRISGSGSVSRR